MIKRSGGPHDPQSLSQEVLPLLVLLLHHPSISLHLLLAKEKVGEPLEHSLLGGLLHLIPGGLVLVKGREGEGDMGARETAMGGTWLSVVALFVV